MTICLAMYCIDSETDKPALLVATDKQFSQGALTSSGQKIYTLDLDDFKGSPGFVFAIAGDIYVAEEAIHNIYEFIEGYLVEGQTALDFLISNKETIGDIAFSVFNKHNVRMSSPPGPIFSILIGVADDDNARIVHVQSDGKVYICGNYAIIGHGILTGGLLLLNEFYRNDLSDWEAAHLACQVITLVSRIDGTVNNKIDYTLVVDNNFQYYDQESNDDIEQVSNQNWDIIKDTFWKLQKEEDFLSKLRKLIEET